MDYWYPPELYDDPVLIVHVRIVWSGDRYRWEARYWHSDEEGWRSFQHRRLSRAVLRCELDAGCAVDEVVNESIRCVAAKAKGLAHVATC